MGKKIIIVTHSAANGGAERVSCTLANQFADHGYDVTLYAIHSDKRQYYLDDKIHYEYCDIKSRSKMLKGLERAKKLREYVLANKYDVFISFIYTEGILLTGKKQVKKIYSLRNDPSHTCNNGISKLIRNKVYRDADNIVFQTPNARDFFEKDISSKGVVIPNPVRVGLPYWNEDVHSKDIVAACRISEQKNLKMMIDAFDIFNKQVPGYRLVIYGKGDLLDSLVDYANSLGLSDKVVFPGFCESIQDKMADAAMYVSSSDYEGISNSMLEALAIGVPSICTDCPIGGAGMHINSGVNGFLVPIKDAKAMAAKMVTLAEDVELQKRFSHESIKLREELTEEKIFQMWNELVK